MLEIALDKPEYKPGEQLTVAITARTAGRVTLNVMGDKLLNSITQEVTPGTAKISVPVGSDWGTGAYVVATLRRPLDAEARRMPGRSIGVQWFAIDKKTHTLALDMKAPALLRPNSKLTIPIKVDGLGMMDQARIVVAAVDVGILNLTNYKPPSASGYYLGQRALSAEIRDLYGNLINPTLTKAMSKKMLGTYLIELGHVKQNHIDQALADQNAGLFPGKRLGDILQAKAIITRAQLDEAIELQMIDSLEG